MKFVDEPVAGQPFSLLPGHSSPGRLERVLRAGGFAVTSELAPPDSADAKKFIAVRGCSTATSMPSTLPTAVVPTSTCRVWR